MVIRNGGGMVFKSKEIEYNRNNGRYHIWYKDDLNHRLKGPAVFYANGDKLWFVDGKLIK